MKLYIKNQNNPANQLLTTAAEVFLMALDAFSGRIYGAVVLAQLNRIWRWGKLRPCVRSLFCPWVRRPCNCIFCLQEPLFILCASDYKA